MNVDEVMTELARLGTAQTKKVLMRHGMPESGFGVKVGDLKTLVKRIRRDHDLALALYDTGNSDAMYLASLIVDDERMTKKDLKRWADKASWQMISEYAVAWAAAESRFGWELGLEWIDSKKSKVAASGWSTLSGVVALRPDDELDLPALERLLARVKQQIGSAPDRLPYVMNGFVISVGSYVAPLFDAALTTARGLGKVEVDMGETDCKVPDAVAMLTKIRSMGRVGKKRKTVRC